LAGEWKQRLDSDAADDLVDSLNNYSITFDETSTDYWATRLLAAQAQWIAHDAEQVQETIGPLEDHFDISVDELMVDSFVDTLAFRENVSTHTHRIQQGFRLIDHLLVKEELTRAKRVCDALEKSIRFVEDDQQTITWRELTRATQQMMRLRKSVAFLDQSNQSNTSEVDDDFADSISVSQSAIVGRYLCLMRCHWKDGIHWMAAGSDARLAPLAKHELQQSDDTSAEERIELAQRWMAASTRESGRPAHAMLLHSRQLLRLAMGKTSRVQSLELETQIAEIESKLPSHLKTPYRSGESNPKAIDGAADESSHTPVMAPNADPSVKRSVLLGVISGSGSDC
jgi:hypothetical protein